MNDSQFSNESQLEGQSQAQPVQADALFGATPNQVPDQAASYAQAQVNAGYPYAQTTPQPSFEPSSLPYSYGQGVDGALPVAQPGYAQPAYQGNPAPAQVGYMPEMMPNVQPVIDPIANPGGQGFAGPVTDQFASAMAPQMGQGMQPVWQGMQPLYEPAYQQAAQPTAMPQQVMLPGAMPQQATQPVYDPAYQQAAQPAMMAQQGAQPTAMPQQAGQPVAMAQQGAQPAATQPAEQPAAGAASEPSPVTGELESRPEHSLESFYASSRIEDIDPLEDDEDDDEELGAPYMQNRELSWLTFNERVLDQGADESVPLLERLNFISIFWSNLREFFMVRVGSLTDLSYIEPPVRDSKTGWTPEEQISAINDRCRELYPIQESYYEHVRGSLAKQGVRHLRPEDLSDEQRNYLSGYVNFNVEPFLSPQIINPTHPFPHLENGKLYILLRLDDEADGPDGKKGKKDKKGKKKKDGAAAGVVLGLIPLPHQCERIIKLPGRGFQFILLEHAIEMFAADIFSMYTIKHTNVICVTRNADIDANQAGDEQDEDYREHMKRLLKQRARLAPVRLECERPLSPVMEKHMLKKLGLKRSQVYDTIVPLDLSFTWGLGSYLSDSKREKLSNPPFSPAWPVAFDRKRRIIDQVDEREVLLSYPYESMDPFVQLLKEAANDPSVISIKITLYRLASQSQLAEALIAAAENGKSVTALCELRARFDESNNIEWSQRFEQAGCNVIYGFHDYKVHSKICCITRRLPDGSIQHITQLGTGNYNEKTAKLYTDLSFITTDETFGRDAVEFFRNMQLENVSDNYEILRVAPLQIKPMILENLDKQIALARAGKPCGAFMKANSITDKAVIEKIAEASQAGVGITLFIRGICCLVPEVKGYTDNVRVVSIVGRLLEHSRIYCFGTPDDCVMYLSSADLMTRNLNKRVEIAWPILSEEIRWRILDYIDVCLHDTAKLRELRPNATYTPLGAFCDLDEDGNSQPAYDAQVALIELAAEASERALEENETQAGEAGEEIASLPLSVDDFEEVTDIAAVTQGIAAEIPGESLADMSLSELLEPDAQLQDGMAPLETVALAADEVAPADVAPEAPAFDAPAPAEVAPDAYAFAGVAPEMAQASQQPYGVPMVQQTQGYPVGQPSYDAQPLPYGQAGVPGMQDASQGIGQQMPYNPENMAYHQPSTEAVPEVAPAEVPYQTQQMSADASGASAETPLAQGAQPTDAQADSPDEGSHAGEAPAEKKGFFARLFKW